MKKIIFLLMGTTLLFVACNSSSSNAEKTNSSDTTKMKSGITSQIFSLDTTKLKSGEVFYQCEMHHEVLSDKAGSCPKCGMDLEKVVKK